MNLAGKVHDYFEKLTLAEATQKIFILQSLVVLFVWSFFGMAYTPPLVMKSDEFPFPVGIAAAIANWILGLIAPKFVINVSYVVTFPSTMLLLMAVTVIPVLEEVLFRGMPLLTSKFSWIKNFIDQSSLNFWTVILGINLCFGMWHTNYPMEWRITTFFFGVSSSWLAFKYRTILPTIRLHYRWNIILATIEFFSSPYVAEELSRMIVFK